MPRILLSRCGFNYRLLAPLLAFFSFCLFSPRGPVRGAFGAAFFRAARFSAFRSALSSIFVVFAILSFSRVGPAPLRLQVSLRLNQSTKIPAEIASNAAVSRHNSVLNDIPASPYSLVTLWPFNYARCKVRKVIVMAETAPQNSLAGSKPMQPDSSPRTNE
jgi:hypothetical protein